MTEKKNLIEDLGRNRTPETQALADQIAEAFVKSLNAGTKDYDPDWLEKRRAARKKEEASKK